MPTADRTTSTLPLRWATPAHWAEGVLRQPLALLNDHAHLERKAAANALEMLGRWPDPTPPESWAQTMTAIARDEVEHLAAVVRLIARRGGRLTRHHRNPYAKALRGLVRLGEGPRELMDRLMISALIEARSCERFEVLAANCPDGELARLYAGLCASERGHYAVFLGLAKELPGVSGDEIDRRWADLLDAEAGIIASQPAGLGMHSGVADLPVQ